ncbi:MAG: tetratricopeptide repeat protein [Desulfovibrionaceae bacterium]|nr:tetratricopeptide repeat protein [Desulfovibrionaceae bacterium]
MSLAPNTKVIQFEKTVIDFIKNQRGCFIVLTHDQAFMSVMRTVITKDLGLVGDDLLIPLQEPNLLTKIVMQAEEQKKTPLLFIERNINGQESAMLINQLRNAFPKLLIIVLTVEIEKYSLMYLHEMGANNFIAKPVSALTIIEKLAFTIKPQTKLGELIDTAKAHLTKGEPERAKQLAAEILEMKPGSAAGLMVLGDAECALGNTQAAKKAYLEASNNADLYLEPLRKLAQLAERIGELEEALGYLEKLDALSPLNSERKIEMGELSLELGDEDAAQQLFEAAITQISNAALEHIALLAERIGGIYEKRDPVKAENYYRKALSSKTKNLTREDMRLFNRLGVSLRRQGKWQEAIDEYKRALQIDDRDSGLLYNMGMAYMEGGVGKEAQRCMEKAISADENVLYTSSGVAYNMGVVFMKNNESERAKQCFEAALKQDPNMEAARKALNRLQ